MRSIVLLAFCLTVCSSAISQSGQTITIKVTGTRLEFVCFNGQEETSPDNLSTKKNISLRFQGELESKLAAVIVTNESDEKVSPLIHAGGKSKDIVGNDEMPVLTILISFSDGQNITVPNVGKARVQNDRSPIKNGKFKMHDHQKGARQANCECNTVKYDKFYNADIVKALDLCPDCGDDDYFVYDALCKVLYKRTKEDEYTRVKDLNSVSFKYNKEFKVKIIHVNRYIKDVRVTAEDLVYESQAPTLFNNVFGAAGQLAGELLKDFDTHGAGKQKTPIEDEFDDFIDMLRDYLETINELREIRNHVFYQCCESLISCGQQHDVTLSGLSIHLFNLRVKYFEVLADLKEAIRGKNKLVEDIARLDAQIKQATGQAKKELEAQKVVKEQALNSLPPLEEMEKRIEIIWKELDKPNEEELRNLVIFNNNFLKQNYTFSTPPIYAQGNRMKLKLTIDSRDTNFVYKAGLQPTDHQELQIEGPVLGKWFVSFSSGPFFGFGNDLYETNYEYRKIPSSGNVVNENSPYTITATGKTDAPVGLAGLAHFQRKWSEGWGWGVSIGAGLTIESKPKLVYLFGPSIFAGDNRQFVLTAGFAGMQVNVLKKELYPDFIVYNSSEALKYGKELRLGGFIALTYTLFTPANKSVSPAADKK